MGVKGLMNFLASFRHQDLFTAQYAFSVVQNPTLAVHHVAIHFAMTAGCYIVLPSYRLVYLLVSTVV